MVREESAQNGQLQIWLSQDECVQIGIERQERLWLREELKDKQGDLKRYKAKLKQRLVLLRSF
ncbi:hypothetical protein OAS14_00805 [Alphaproteobacteria bacterium]|nr:hypothetical protein [Alphaproteobacteria bacterium]